jgi:hypothetical protein
MTALETIRDKMSKALEPLKIIFELAINNPHANIRDKSDIEKVRKAIVYIEQDIYGIEE